MSLRSWPLPGLLLALTLLAGCGRAPVRPTGTGAKQAVQEFFEALRRQDWKRAYAALHPESRARCPVEQFARLAQAYYRDLGFEPDALQVRSCEEHGDEALAHIVFSGPSHSFKDAATLRRDADGWRVLLSSHFGRSKGR